MTEVGERVEIEDVSMDQTNLAIIRKRSLILQSTKEPIGELVKIAEEQWQKLMESDDAKR